VDVHFNTSFDAVTNENTPPTATQVYNAAHFQSPIFDRVVSPPQAFLKNGKYKYWACGFDPPSMQSLPDLDMYNVAVARGQPLPLPDPQPTDPMRQTVLPSFTRSTITGSTIMEQMLMQRVHPSLQELSFMQAALHAVAHVVSTGALCPVPGSSSGDMQQFYDLDCTLDLPPDMVLGRPGAPRTVRIKVRVVVVDVAVVCRTVRGY